MKIGRYAVVAVRRVDGEDSQDVIGTADTFESLCQLILHTYRTQKETLVSIDVFRRMSLAKSLRPASLPESDLESTAERLTVNYQV